MSTLNKIDTFLNENRIPIVKNCHCSPVYIFNSKITEMLQDIRQLNYNVEDLIDFVNDEYNTLFIAIPCFNEWLRSSNGKRYMKDLNSIFKTNPCDPDKIDLLSIFENEIPIYNQNSHNLHMREATLEFDPEIIDAIRKTSKLNMNAMSHKELSNMYNSYINEHPHYIRLGAPVGGGPKKPHPKLKGKPRSIKTKPPKKKRSTRKRNMWKEGDIKGHLTKTQKIKSILKKINALHEYNIHQEVGLYLPPSNQRHSGRCWLFSFLNSLRLSCIVKYKLPPTFSFSAAYMLFWDKYEKSKYFLDRVSSQSHLPMENVDNHFLFRSMVSDGGTWNMLQNIVTTYGVVPYDSMKESHHTTNTNEMNDILIKFLQTSAKKIRASPPAKHTQLINDHMKKVYSLLTKCVGVPPKKVPSLKKNNKCTPLELYQNEISPLPSNDVMKKVVMIHVPNLKENQYYVIDELNNKTNGHVLYYYNVNLKVFKSSVLSQIKACSPVWFGCDFGKFNHKGESLLNDQAFSFDTFPLKKKELILPKSNAISMYQTNVNHAMLFTGYYYKNSHQKPYYWTIENSHGDKMKNVSYHSNHGFITMSDSWFDQYVVMAVVDETHFQGVINAKDKNNAIVLPKWSNLGELLFQ
tara:strand:+ start:521 stop:2419 length:1899 start_codon:yes stop_codon:yes gene_type:complete